MRLSETKIGKEMLAYTKNMFLKPDDLIEIRYEQLSHGVKATLVVTPAFYKSVSAESSCLLIDTFAMLMQTSGVVDSRPFVVLQAAEQ